MRIEPGPGGWPLESFTVDGNEHLVQMGHTLAWEPPHRLLLQWRAVNFAPHEHTEVEVLFQASDTGTIVTATYRGWAATRFDHPVRHGLETAAFVRMMGLRWGDLPTTLRQRCVGRALARAGPRSEDLRRVAVQRHVLRPAVAGHEDQCCTLAPQLAAAREHLDPGCVGPRLG